MKIEKENWSLVIEPKDEWWNLRLGELWEYRDLIVIFVRRDLVSIYKQTVLGPLWFFLSPLFTAFMYSFVFGTIAGISTDGVPAPAFYLAGTTLWNYFSTCFNGAAKTFTSNASIFGKVYFPRLTAPIAMIISNLLKFFIQLLMFLGILFYYRMQDGSTLHFTNYIFLFPLLVFLMGSIALGVGIIISSMTTKYRDLNYFIGFGVTLLMYASPVIYPVSAIPENYSWFIDFNPIAPILEVFRLGFTGSGSFSLWGLLYSCGFALVFLLLGAVVFHQTERTFMDTI